jgi:hypothetical protein
VHASPRLGSNGSGSEHDRPLARTNSSDSPPRVKNRKNRSLLDKQYKLPNTSNMLVKMSEIVEPQHSIAVSSEENLQIIDREETERVVSPSIGNVWLEVPTRFNSPFDMPFINPVISENLSTTDLGPLSSPDNLSEYEVRDVEEGANEVEEGRAHVFGDIQEALSWLDEEQ